MPGVGTVVAGTVKRGVIHVNSNLMLGPDIGDGSFWTTAVKSVHYKRMPVNQVGRLTASGCHRWMHVAAQSCARTTVDGAIFLRTVCSFLWTRTQFRHW